MWRKGNGDKDQEEQMKAEGKRWNPCHGLWTGLQTILKENQKIKKLLTKVR